MLFIYLIGENIMKSKNIFIATGLLLTLVLSGCSPEPEDPYTLDQAACEELQRLNQAWYAKDKTIEDKSYASQLDKVTHLASPELETKIKTLAKSVRSGDTSKINTNADPVRDTCEYEHKIKMTGY
jgi:hypothetical protein